MRTIFQKGRTFFAALACALVLTSCMEDEIVNPNNDTSLESRFTTSPTSGTSTIMGLSADNQLYTITATKPASVTKITPITGLKDGDAIIAIDFRTTTGELYGLSSTGYLYVLNPSTGAATQVTQTPIELAGSQFGFDFNPRTDMITIVSDKGQNISVNPMTGAVVNAYWSTNVMSRINSIAFMSSSQTTTGALMYDISGADYKLYAQNEKTGALTTIGSTGLLMTGDGGFDISRTGQAFAIFTAKSDGTTTATWSTSPDDMTQEASRLFSINLKTGAATSYGKVGSNLIGMAIM